MAAIDNYMTLSKGERVVMEIQGNAYNLDSNIIARLISFFVRIIAVLTGSSKKIHLYVTQRRVITIEINKMLFFIDGSVVARSYTPRSISQIGYMLSRSMIIFKSHYLEFVSGRLGYAIKAKGGKEKVDRVIKSIVNLAEPVAPPAPKQVDKSVRRVDQSTVEEAESAPVKKKRRLPR